MSHGGDLSFAGPHPGPAVASGITSTLNACWQRICRVFDDAPGHAGGILTSVLFCVTVAMLGTLPAVSLADNISSSPSGYRRYDVSGGAQVLASMPFDAADGHIAVLLQGQLTGSTDEESSDRVLKWDALAMRYVAAYRALDPVTGEPLWISDFETRAPSSMSLEPGEGFWIESRQSFSQSLVLAGRVVMASERTMRLEPALNLVGYPFATSIDLERTGLATLWREDPSTGGDTLVGSPAVDPGLQPIESFRMGEGYWYLRAGSEPVVWTESRPYANPFPTNGAPPQILALASRDDASVVLTVACGAGPNERLDIFYRDVSCDLPFDPLRGWSVAESGIASDGRTLIDWEDRGLASRSAPDVAIGRLYLVARADIDSDGDGVSDARELFIHGTDPGIHNGVGNTLPNPGDGDDAGDSVITGPDGSDETSPALDSGLGSPGRIVYVDGRHGHDGFSGRAATARDGLEGPKRSIRAALGDARDGDMLVIGSARYGEDLPVAGRSLSVFIDGDVDLSGEPPHVVGVGQASLLSPGGRAADLVGE